MIENRVLIEITNESEHTFVFDDDWFRAGGWKSDRRPSIPAKSNAVLELESQGVKGVAGIAWWTDAQHHNVYLSMTFANPRLEKPTFSCCAGLPPPNLMANLSSAPNLVQGEQHAPDGAGCAWLAATVGNLTAVKLTIFGSLPCYEAPTAAAYAEAAKRAEAEAAKAKAEAAKTKAKTAQNGAASASFSYLQPAPGEPPFSHLPPAPGEPPLRPASGEPPMSNALVPLGAPVDAVATVDEKEAAAREALGKFMAQTRPKDALDGLSKGVKTATASLAAGVGNVITSTVGGYQAMGALGVVRGLGTGILGGAAIAVGGTCCGVAQIGRGIVNTPDAIRYGKEQRVWDQELGQWVDIDLCALEAQLEAEGSDDEDAAGESASSSSGVCAGPVADMEYYDLLNVPSTATASEIKKAYYKEARKCHPDKNPGDAEAKAKFQKLADAYQILSDSETRKKYDREGKAGIQEPNVTVDPSVFFSLLFGSEKFETWIGELHLAMQTDEFAKTLEKEVVHSTAEAALADADKLQQSMRRRQVRREIRCACHLREKLDRFVTGRDEAGWVEQVRQEAVDLAHGQFGPQLLITLGEMYQLRADLYLADELVGRYSLTKRAASVKHSTAVTSHRFQFYRTAASSLVQAKRVHDVARTANSAILAARESSEAEGSTERENVAQPLEEEHRQAVEHALDLALPHFLQTAWHAVVTDIDGTTKEVGRKLLKDKSVCWQIRLRRAKALQRLGQIFVEEGTKAQAAAGEFALATITSEAAKETLETALTGSMKEKR